MTSNMRIDKPSIQLCTALGVLAFAGCSLLQVKTEEYSTYSLDIQSSPAEGDAVVWQLQVEEPIAATPIAGVRIAERDSDRSFGVLRAARWSERAPALVQSAILRSLEDCGCMRGVARTSSSLHGDYLLSTELRDFQVEYSTGGAAVVNITISAKLLNTQTGQAVDARIFSATESVHGNAIGPVASAFNSAANRVLPQLRDWVLDGGQKDFRERKAMAP